MANEEKAKKPTTIADLREDLVDTMRLLKDGKIDEKKAKVISDISGRIIDAGKLELDFMKHTEKHESEFLSVEEAKRRAEIEAKKLLPENEKYFKKSGE